MGVAGIGGRDVIGHLVGVEVQDDGLPALHVADPELVNCRVRVEDRVVHAGSGTAEINRLVDGAGSPESLCVDQAKVAASVVAALALGAEGVTMGTRFMVSQESGMHPKLKEWFLQASETDTIMIQRSIRNAARVIKTAYSQKILEMEEKGATLEELMPLISGHLGRKALQETGDIESALIYSGQSVGLIREAPSVKEIIDSIISEAKLIGQRLKQMGVS